MVRQSRTKVPVENLVPLAEAAVRFGVSVKTLRRRISDGTVTGYGRVPLSGGNSLHQCKGQ